MKLQLTKNEAKELLVKYHMINTNDHLFGKEGIMTVMDRLLSIQVDPLDVVGKNIDLVMQSRVKDYKRTDIHKLLYEDRTLIDGWDKMMAVYKTEDFPKLEHIRKYMSEGHRKNIINRFDYDTHSHKDIILEMINEGPKYSKDISLGDRLKYGYNTAKASSITLDYLYYNGDIGVRDRTNTQKRYDILENLIGELAHSKSPFKTDEEFAKYFLLRRIKSLGLTSNKSGVHMSGPLIRNKVYRTKILQMLLDEELVHEVNIEGLKDKCYIPNEALNLDNEILEKASFIAPLDNIIWERDLIEKLFDFNYRWEVYTPIKKRQYGYYVLPVLYKSNFVGRIEFHKHRKKEELKEKKRWIEDGYDKNIVNKCIDDAIVQFKKYLLGE